MSASWGRNRDSLRHKPREKRRKEKKREEKRGDGEQQETRGRNATSQAVCWATPPPSFLPSFPHPPLSHLKAGSHGIPSPTHVSKLVPT